MAPGRAWLATLVERAVRECLADNASAAHSSPSSHLFPYQQNLSNLRITPDSSLLHTAHLVDIRAVDVRGQRQEVKAVIGDLEHTIRATLTKAALSEIAISTKGVPFTHIRVGAVFKILACEILVSDCFKPPRIDIRISSFAVICPGSGAAQFPHLKRAEDVPSVSLNLEEYSLRRGGSMDSDEENHEPMASQEAFMTQIPYQSLKAPSPNRFNLQSLAPPAPISQKLLERSRNIQTKPLDKVHTNMSGKDNREDRLRGLRATSGEDRAPSTSQFVTQIPLQIETRSGPSQSPNADTIKATELKKMRQSAPGSNGKSPVIDHCTTTQKSCQETSKPGRSLWQRRTAAARYVPRYARTRSRDQQELIANDASWQPSLIGQPSIKGQIPIELLDRMSRTVDNSVEGENHGIQDEESSEDQEVDFQERGTRSLIETGHRRAGSAQQQSPLQASSQTSWEASPERPAQIRPRLPPDSSPLQIDDSIRSSAPADQEMGSSPFSGVADSDKEDSVLHSPVSSETPIMASAQVTMPEAASNSLDQTGDMSSSVRSQKGDVEGAGEKLYISLASAEHSSTDFAVHAATSSLDSVRKVQVSRTPAVQKCYSDPMDTCREVRSVFSNANQDGRPLLQTNSAQSFPPSSFIVSGSDAPRQTMEAGPARVPLLCSEIPVLGPLPQGTDQIISADNKAKQTGQPTSGDVTGKRKRQDSIDEGRSKQRKSKPPRGKPVATGTDLDLIDWEIKLRQWRRDDIAELDEHRQLARVQRSPIAAVINDVNSVESRERPLSSGSSVLSIAKRRVSTPITRSSDYQISNVNKHQRDCNASREPSPDQVVPQNMFELFRLTYPSYEGGRAQFNLACQHLQSLGQRAPKPWYWDDFVYRYYNTDYMEYQQACSAAGEPSLPFELFYVDPDHAKRPISLGKVLKDDHLPLTHASSIGESTPGILIHPSKAPRMFRGQSLDVGSSKGHVGLREPQLPPRPPRVEARFFAEANLSKPNIQSQSINHSQDSSVKIWLEKAYGAESPELGTPPIAKNIMKVSLLDIEAPSSSPAPAKRNRSRRVPWHNLEEPWSSTAQSAPTYTGAQTFKAEKGKGKVPRRHTEFPIRKQEDGMDLTGPIVFQKPRPNAETAFMKLQTNFDELDRRREIPKAPTQKLVDIFSWRK